MMQVLDAHSYNIYKYAYIAPNTNCKTQNMAYLAAIMQFAFVVVLVYYNVMEPLADFVAEYDGK